MWVIFDNPKTEQDIQTNKESTLALLHHLFYERNDLNTEWLVKAIQDDVHTWKMALSNVLPDKEIALDKMDKRGL